MRVHLYTTYSLKRQFIEAMAISKSALKQVLVDGPRQRQCHNDYDHVAILELMPAVKSMLLWTCAFERINL